MRIAPLLAGSAALFGAFSVAHAQADAPYDPAQIARGEYLAKAADCAACHRTREDSGKAFVGGYVITSPMGDIVAPNITPSKTAGIGAWSFEDFDRAIRKGVRPGGAPLYPAMPYTDYQGVSDADMHALYAYFMHGVTPVDTIAPKTHLPFPFGIRAIMIPWNWVFLSHKPFIATAGLSPQAQRGQYLVQTLGHCGACHTPRNLLMAERPSKAFAGADLGGWHAPNITSDPISGVGGWGDAEIAKYLANGHVSGKGVAAGGMAEAVDNSLRYMTPADQLAIAAYLKSTTPIRDPHETRAAFNWTSPKPVPLSAYETGDNHKDQAALKDSSTTDGATLYAGACASCHGLQGQGSKDDFYAPLVGSSTTGSANPSDLVMTILTGVNRTGADGKSFMPAFAEQMNDDQVAAVANHVFNHFGRADTQVTAEQVAVMRKGGAKPLLVTAMPWLLGLGALAGLGIVAFIVLRMRKRA